MTAEEENRILDRLMPILFNKDHEWSRENLNHWPDGVVNHEGRSIALELTELIHEEDKIHRDRKRIGNFERQLAHLLEIGFRERLGGFGAQIDVEVNLDLEILTSAKIRKLGKNFFEVLDRNFQDEVIQLKIGKEIKVSLVDLFCTMKILRHHIICNVGYIGARMDGVKTDYIQKVIERKKKIDHAYERFDECWLILVESLDIVRSEIDRNGIFITWYDRVYLYREIGDCLESEIETIIRLK